MSKNTKLYLQSLLDGTGLTDNDVVDPNTKSIIDEARKCIYKKIELNLEHNKLHPILSKIGQQTTIKQNSKHSKVFKPVRLDNNDDAIFAIDDEAVNHKALFTTLKKEIQKLKEVEDNSQKAYTLYHLLYAYGSRTSLGQKPSVISLFDRNRILAAVANCLCEKNGDESLDKDKPFILIKGAISGIQEFIYNDIDKSEVGNTRQLAKKLRGRSSYVGLLTDIVAEQLAEELGLEMANVIFSGGGNFIVVAPNTQNTTIIDDFIRKTNKMLQAKMGNRISLLIAYNPCEEDLFRKTSKYYQKINDTLESLKTQKHVKYIKTTFEYEHQEKDSKYDVEIGKLLPKSDFLIEIKTKSHLLNKKNVVLNFEDWNLYYLAPKVQIKDGIKKIKEEIKKALNKVKKTLEKDEIESCKIIALNDTEIFSQLYDIQKDKDFSFPIGFGFKFIGKSTPKAEFEKEEQDSTTDNDNTDVLSFDELAKLDYTKKGPNGEIILDEENTLQFRRLAVMRWDIDDLGALFSHGLPHKDFMHIAAFSREIHLFFSGYINILAEKYQLYVVYSGGDDAFIIGSWFNVINFAIELHNKFQKFTCNNEDIGYSAGIFICHENYPVARFADDAADLEKKSKSFRDSKGILKDKNSVTLFNHTLSWEQFKCMMSFAKILLNYTHQNEKVKEPNKLARSMVHRLFRIIQSCYDEEGIKIDTKKLKLNMSRLHYLLARHGFTNEVIQKAETDLVKYVIAIILKHFQIEELIENYKIPLQYVLLRTRKIQ